MSRRSKHPTSASPDSSQRRQQAAKGGTNPERPAADRGHQPQPHRGPSTAIKLALSAWLLFHFLATFVSYTSVVAPSETQTRLENMLQFYLQPTHFSTDQRRLYLAHGGTLEQPHRLQVTTVDLASDSTLLSAEMDDDRWITLAPAGIAGLVQSDRYARWLSTAAMLAENEQPSLVAELLLPRLRQMIEEDQQLTAIRIVRLPTQLTTTAQDALPAPYAARVAQQGDKIALVQVQEPRLLTAPRGANSNE